MKHDDPSKSNSKATGDQPRPRSGGPQTPEGKQRSSANSRRHGVLSESICVLASESDDEYCELIDSYLAELNPVGLLETHLVQKMAWAEWRQIRAISVESATLDDQMERTTRCGSARGRASTTTPAPPRP